MAGPAGGKGLAALYFACADSGRGRPLPGFRPGGRKVRTPQGRKSCRKAGYRGPYAAGRKVPQKTDRPAPICTMPGPGAGAAFRPRGRHDATARPPADRRRVRVKRWGKSPPPREKSMGQGKPLPEQDQIGGDGVARTAPAAKRDKPRVPVAQMNGRRPPRRKQNPAYSDRCRHLAPPANPRD